MTTEGLTSSELQTAEAVVAELPTEILPPIEAPVPTPAPPMVVPSLDDSSLDIHRELSQLQFNIRVLEQALDESHPLLDRLNFLLFFPSTREGFLEIRVAGLKKQITFPRERAG